MVAHVYQLACVAMAGHERVGVCQSDNVKNSRLQISVSGTKCIVPSPDLNYVAEVDDISIHIYISRSEWITLGSRSSCLLLSL